MQIGYFNAITPVSMSEQCNFFVIAGVDPIARPFCVHRGDWLQGHVQP